MSERKLGPRGNPEVRGEPEHQTSMQQDLDSLTGEETDLVLARLEALGLDPRDSNFERERDKVIRGTLEIKLQRAHSQGERI